MEDAKYGRGTSTAVLARAINRFMRAHDTARAVSAIRDLVALLDANAVERKRVIRPDDLFVADFLFHNLTFTPNSPVRLVRKQASKPAHMSMELQGQHFGEEVLIFSDAPPVPPSDVASIPQHAPPAPPHVMRARLAYPSRIVVRMPDTVLSIEYTLDKLLEVLTTWPLSLDPLARAAFPVVQVAFPLDGMVVQRVDRRRLNVAVENLRPAATAMLALLRDMDAEAFGQTAYRQAVRDAGAAVAALREGKPAAARALPYAEEQEERLDDPQSHRGGARQIANALYEVVLAAKIAERAAQFEAPNWATLIDLSKLFWLWLMPHEPTDLVTALELPYRLITSPHASATFAHLAAPKTLAGRTELWRTTLSERTDDGPQPLGVDGAPFTAMWSPDYSGSDPLSKKDPFLMSLRPRFRDNLVRLMSGHGEQRTGGGRYIPRPATAYRLQLSAWGGVLEADGDWKVLPQGYNVEAWSHDASYGRDERVRVDEAGYLFPYGHRATKVTLTERVVEDQNPSGVGAFLRQYIFIIVREHEKDYPRNELAFDGRKLPFLKLTCLTRRSPFLQMPPVASTVVPGLNGDTEAFWPIVAPGSDPALFEFEAIDLAGRRSVFTSPAIFVYKSFAENPAGDMPKLHDGWSGPSGSPNQRADIAYGGQVVRMAPLDGGTAGDVDVPLNEITFEGIDAAGQLPPFHPAIRAAEARLKALAAIQGAPAFKKVEYEDGTYLPKGYTDNPWKVFLKLPEPYEVRMGQDVSTDKVGGIGQPSQSLSAISNGSGAVSGSVSSLTAGNVAPGDMFPEATIMGDFDLKDLIAPFVATGLGAIPGFTTKEYSDRIVTSWEYSNDDVDSPIPGLVTGAGGDSALELSAKLTAWFTYPDPDLGFKNKDGDPAPDFGAGTDPGWKDPEIEATGKLTNFKLNFLGFVIVWFDEFSFKSTLKNKFDPNPDLHDDHPVVFGGPLEFVNELSDLIPSGGFTDPPIIKPSLTDLQVGYDFALPAVTVGIFSLKNMKIGAVLKIPFRGDPISLRFFFSTREKPFLLTVSLYGGGGFFALVTTAAGVQEIEAAFEFGAFAAFDVGVASGGVYVKAGIYFHWKTDAVELEGYVEMGGELSVLGLISVSVTLHLSLGYYKEGTTAEVRGQAQLKIEVEVLFFSTTVTLQVERRFAGSEGDPSFAQLITDQPTWSRYCAAFA
jgi:hypothetical protein